MMEQIESNETALEVAYELDYEIDDVIFSEPFKVLKSVNIGRPPWWGSKEKVLQLISAFKLDYEVDEAIIQAGISRQQYHDFCRVHQDFAMVQARCRRVGALVAKRGLIADLGNPKNPAARQWYLERKQPHLYGRDIGAYTSPPPSAASKITAEAFIDENGKVLVSRQTKEVLKQEYGKDSDNEDGGN